MIWPMTDQTLVAPHAQVSTDVVVQRGDGEQLTLEQARAGLLIRLHNRSDDFAATRELQAVSARLVELKSRVHLLESDRHAKRSSLERTPFWRRSTSGGRGRRAEASARAGGPRPEAPSTTRGEPRDGVSSSTTRELRASASAAVGL
jgi:hypothetical protein